jgi:hypothetical protein
MQEFNSSQPSEANSPPNFSIRNIQSKYRCHCGYEPEGKEQWKASNLRRHKRTQHSFQLKLSCNYPGCSSIFTRSDNLRSHQREKEHATEIIFVQSSSSRAHHLVENDERDNIRALGTITRPPKRRRTTDPSDMMYR